MKLSVFPSSMETARSLIFHLVDIMNAEPDKTFNIAVSGGSTPALMFDLWANEYADITPWGRMKLYWVDERCVPPEDSDSNYGMMRSLLLGIVPIPYENVFRIRGEEKPVKEAARYSELVDRQVPKKNGWPEFDIVLLGAGEDGHTSSIFPGQEALLSSDQISYSECPSCYFSDYRKSQGGSGGRNLSLGRYGAGSLYSPPCGECGIVYVCRSRDVCPERLKREKTTEERQYKDKVIIYKERE